MASRLVRIVVVLLLTPLAGVQAEPQRLRAPVEASVKVRAKPTAGPAFLQYGAPAVLAPGEHDIAGVRFTVTAGKRHVAVSWTDLDGNARTAKLKGAKGQRLVLRSKPKQTLFVFPDRLGRWHHLPGAGHRFKVRGIEFEVLDGDHDGVLFEVDGDLIRRVGDRHAVPLRAPHVVEAIRLTIRRFDAQKSKLEVTVAPVDAELNEEELTALRTVNRERERTGLLGAVSLLEFARPLRKHANWMAIHAKVQHHEEPDTEGYTPEGNAAGNASVILTHPTLVDIATYTDIDSAIHGYVLTMPEFVQTGVGVVRAKKSGTVYGGIWTMEQEGFKHAQVESARFPAVWPPHMATDVPRSWTREGEDPRLPEDRGREQGYPIRVYLSPGVLETAKLEDMTFTLIAQEKKAEPLDCFVIAPDRPLGYEPSPYLAHLLGRQRPIFVLPRPILKAETWYVLRIKGTVDGKPLEYESAFRTGVLRGQYRNRKVGDRRIGR